MALGWERLWWNVSAKLVEEERKRLFRSFPFSNCKPFLCHPKSMVRRAGCPPCSPCPPDSGGDRARTAPSGCCRRPGSPRCPGGTGRARRVPHLALAFGSPCGVAVRSGSSGSAVAVVLWSNLQEWLLGIKEIERREERERERDKE